MHTRNDNSDPCASTRAIISVGNQTFTPKSQSVQTVPAHKVHCTVWKGYVLNSPEPRSDLRRQLGKKNKKKKCQFLITLRHLSEHAPPPSPLPHTLLHTNGLCDSLVTPVVFTPCLPLCVVKAPLYTRKRWPSHCQSVKSNKLNTELSCQNKIFMMNSSPLVLLFINSDLY